MKPQAISAILTTFAKLAEAARGDELRRFAGIFSGSKEKTIATHVKKLQSASGYPATLKTSLEIIQAGFAAAGATKQVTAFGVLLNAFAGRANISVDTFITEITTAPPQKSQIKRGSPRSRQEPDYQLGSELADELRRTMLDTGSFNAVVARLRDGKNVNTPTLAIIANRFLGKSKAYTDRKSPIEDIVRRQKADAREHARGQALSRLGV
jgi:hypothetical protein